MAVQSNTATIRRYRRNGPDGLVERKFYLRRDQSEWVDRLADRRAKTKGFKAGRKGASGQASQIIREAVEAFKRQVEL